MGFYGNITNTSNTTFQFDRIYPNRLNMDSNVNSDGIFIGRYVLVEYQQSAAYPIVYTKDNQFYSSPNCEDITRIKFLSGDRKDNTDENNDGYFDGIYQGEFVQTQQIGEDKTTIKFYQCTGNDGEYAVFEEVTPDTSKSNYITNFGIDEYHYSNEKGFKGYDSTVWVKTSINQDGKLIAKYVNIADLNSVVPTFDIAADAPTMNPITPHFDADSTNVYYKLHIQPPYGFRVAASEGKSDEKITWTTTNYDKATNTTTTITTDPFDGDIYYNKAGFNPEVVSKVTGDNYIKIAPTAKSGAIYSHGQEENDIQEFRLHLPAIGNMMSDAWDIIHGPNRDDAQTDDNSSLQGRLDSFKAMEKDAIPMKRNSDGTFVGSRINGNSNRTVGTNKILEENLSTSFDQDDAWIRTEIDTTGLDNTNKLSGISIHHTWHKQADTTSITNKNTDNVSSSEVSDKIDLYTPIVDKAGHIVGKNTETVTLPYGYKTIKTNGLVDVTNIDLDSSIGRESVADNTQDTLNIDTKNKWLQIEVTNDKVEIAHEIHDIEIKDKTTTDLNDGTDTITIQDTIYDNAGHVTDNQKHTYILPYGYKKIVAVNTDEVSAAPVDTTDEPTADNTQDTLKLTASNKWIKFNTENTDDNNEVQIGHLLKTVSTTDSEQSLSSETGVTTFEVYNDSFDEAGHYKGRDTKTITMPFGYGKIKGDSGNSEASATYDEFSVLSGDDWIKTEATKDTITITHTGPVVSTVETKSNVEKPSFGSTFTIEDWHFDDKGHMHTSGKTHTVQFPEGSIKHPNSTSSNSEIITALSFDSKNGEISYQKDNSSTLKLTTNYTTNEISAGAISGGDTINTAFAKLEKQVIKETSEREAAVSKEVQDRNTAINTAIANLVDSAPDNLNTLREITEWLDSNKDGTIDITLDIAENAKNIGLETVRAKQAEQALGERIDKINSTQSAVAGNYISSITISNDTLSIGETALPTYTLATGDNNGQVKFNGNNVDIKGLGSAAFTNSSEYATATQGALAETAIQSTTEFIYTEEFRDSETNEVLIPEVKVTIEQLIQKIVDLEAEIKALKGE